MLRIRTILIVLTVALSSVAASLNSFGAPSFASLPSFLSLFSQDSISGWGTVINPDGDCTLTATNDNLTIAIPGTDHALRPERHKMNAPRVMQDVTGTFDIQVKISADFSPSAKSVAPGRSAYQDAGLLVWLDDKNNLKLSRAQIILKGTAHNYFNLEFRHNGQVGELPFPPQAASLLKAGAVYLRLQIHAEGTIAGISADGENWVTTTLPGTDRPEKLQAGIPAENNTSSPLKVVFDEFAVSPAAEK